MRNLTMVLCTEVQTPRNQEMTKIMSLIRIKSQNSHSWAVNAMIVIDLIESDGLKIKCSISWLNFTFCDIDLEYETSEQRWQQV